jgi:hypothetical protein
MAIELFRRCKRALTAHGAAQEENPAGFLLLETSQGFSKRIHFVLLYWVVVRPRSLSRSAFRALFPDRTVKEAAIHMPGCFTAERQLQTVR